MLEMILLTAILIVSAMAWGKISKALDWTGDRIGETGDMLSDLSVSGSKQTARGVIISDNSLEDTIAEAEEKAIKRARTKATFMEGLTKDELKHVNDKEKYYDKFRKR